VGRKGAGGVLSWTASTWHKSLVVTRQADPFVWHSFSRLFPYFLPYLLMMQSLVGFLGGEKQKRIWCIFELNLASPPIPRIFPLFHRLYPSAFAKYKHSAGFVFPAIGAWILVASLFVHDGNRASSPKNPTVQSATQSKPF